MRRYRFYASTVAAGKEVLRLAKEHLKRRESFAVETTLSGKNYLQMMQYARDLDEGFGVVLIYIGTERVEVSDSSLGFGGS